MLLKKPSFGPQDTQCRSYSQQIQPERNALNEFDVIAVNDLHRIVMQPLQTIALPAQRMAYFAEGLATLHSNRWTESGPV